MTTPPPPETSEETNPTIGDVFPPWKEWSDRLTKFFSFLRTRRAVMRGLCLWEMRKDEIALGLYLEPWAFNLYQSTLVALPGACTLAVMHFFGLNSSADRVSIQQKSALGEPLYSYFANISAYLDTLIVPLTLGLACFVAGRVSLNPSDRTPERLSRARRAYLYLDGAYGLWPQFVYSFVATVWFSDLLRVHWVWVLLDFFWPLLVPVILWNFIYQYQLTRWKIPKALFKINGYNSEYPRSWTLFKKDPHSSMWRRTYVMNILVVTIGGFLLHYAFYIVALCLAYAALFARSLVQA